MSMPDSPGLSSEQMIAQNQKIREEIAELFGGEFPSADDIGPPEGEPFAARAKRLVDRAAVYHSFRTLSSDSIDEKRTVDPKNPLLATSLLFHDLIDRLLAGDETARNAICLLAHLEVQMSHALTVARNKLAGGRKGWDGDFLSLYGKMITSINRVNALMAGGLGQTKAWEQAAQELGLSTDQVRGYCEGRG